MASNRVYFMRNPQTGEIKIGQSHNVRARKTSLERDEGCKLELLGTLRAPLLERELHERFAKQRTRGEWFNPSPDLLAFIASIPQEATMEPTPSNGLRTAFLWFLLLQLYFWLAIILYETIHQMVTGLITPVPRALAESIIIVFSYIALSQFNKSFAANDKNGNGVEILERGE